MFLLEFQVLLVESVDTINHALHQFNFGVAQAMLVADVIGVSGLATRFTSGATGLHLQLLAPLLQGIQALLSPSGQVDVHGGPHASAQVGRAGVNIAEFGAQDEVSSTLSLDRVSNGLDAAGQSLKDSLDITTLLHGDDPELILLIDPDQEGLGFVVEDAAALGPVTLHAGYLQVGVSRHKEEMVIDQLLADLLIHAGQRVVVARQVTYFN